MSKWDKLIMRIHSLSKDLRFEELKKVLESYGYKASTPKGGSSHYKSLSKKAHYFNGGSVRIPRHDTIKQVYVEMVKQVVESEERNNENFK